MKNKNAITITCRAGAQFVTKLNSELIKRLLHGRGENSGSVHIVNVFATDLRGFADDLGIPSLRSDIKGVSRARYLRGTDVLCLNFDYAGYANRLTHETLPCSDIIIPVPQPDFLRAVFGDEDAEISNFMQDCIDSLERSFPHSTFHIYSCAVCMDEKHFGSVDMSVQPRLASGLEEAYLYRIN